MHTRVWDGKRIIDTHDIHELYFGLLLSEVDALEFIWRQILFLLPGLDAFNQRVAEAGFSTGGKTKAVTKRTRPKSCASTGSKAG
jgi:hypothetical protein